MFQRIKKWYKQGLWTVEMVRNAVIKNVITPTQFKEITDKEYKTE